MARNKHLPLIDGGAVAGGQHHERFGVSHSKHVIAEIEGHRDALIAAEGLIDELRVAERQPWVRARCSQG